MKANGYSADITYLKYPINVENLTDNDESQFPRHMWNEIIGRAVSLALENTESVRT